MSIVGPTLQPYTLDADLRPLTGDRSDCSSVPRKASVINSLQLLYFRPDLRRSSGSANPTGADASARQQALLTRYELLFLIYREHFSCKMELRELVAIT